MLTTIGFSPTIFSLLIFTDKNRCANPPPVAATIHAKANSKMKIKLLLATMLLCKTCFSQRDSSKLKSYDKIIVYISGGLTIPTGNITMFEGYSYPDINYAGTAKLGYNGRLNMFYLLSENFGLALSLFETNNKANSPDSADLFRNCYCGGLGGGSVMQNYTYNSSTWLTRGFLLGLTSAIHSGKMSLMIRVTPGFQKVESPETQIYQEGYIWQLNWNTTYKYADTQTQPSLKSDYNFVFNCGADLFFELNKSIRFIFGMDYFTSHSTFKGMMDYKSYSGYSQSNFESQSSFSFSKDISLFNFNLGIGYVITSSK